MSRRLPFLCAAMLAQPLFGAQSMREVSFMVASHASRPPAVDGVLDDACWAEGVANTNYYTFIRRSETPRRVFEPRTECTVMYDGKCLYIGVRNWEKDTKSLRQQRIKDQDPDIWTDDSAELYFDPEAHGESFYRFNVNSLGKCDHLWRMDAANVHHEWVAEGAVAAAKVFDDRWEFELAIPWASLKDVRCPGPGTVWTFNHNRYRYPGGEFDGLVDATRGMVSSPGASFTTPHMFGYLYFSEGRPPVAEAVLKEVASRAKGEWAIEIDGTTYLHDATGTRSVAVPASEAIAARLAEEEAREKKYDALAARLKAGEEGDYEPLPLPLAGTFDERGPTAYDGFDGFYRQNASTGGYTTAHFDWRDSVGKDRLRVLFLTDYGATMRDAVEFAQRFPVDIDVYPGDFGDTGIYVDAVSRGGFIDKARQFETFLARNPDAIVLSGMPRAKIPPRYRYEMLRRIKKEGVGFLDLAADRSLDAPPLTPDWRAEYERRAVRLWNRLRMARGLKPQTELEAAVERRIAAELSPAFGPLKFLDGPDSVPEGGTLTATLVTDKSFGEGERLEVFVRTSPYGELRARFDVAAEPGGRTASFKLENRGFPTLAAVVEARRVSAAGEVAARAKKFFYFPNHRWTDYTLISWDGPGIAKLKRSAAGTMAPLYAPQLVEMAGYRNAILGDGPGSAVFNAHPIPYPCRVRFVPGPSNVTYWLTAASLPQHQRDRRRVDMLKAMGKEINPYDPEVRKIMEESFENVVTNMVGYGVSAWSLGDECSFSIEAGNGPKDAVPFREFLAGKYGSVARYNELRGTSYGDFSEVPRPTARESAARGDVAAWWDHVQYMEKMYHDTMLFFADIVHRHDPDARVGAEGSVPGDLEKQIEGLMFWGPYRSLVDDELLRVIAPDRLRGIWWGGYFRCLRDGFPVQQWEYILTGTLNADLWFDMNPGSVMGAFGGDFNPAPYFERMLPHLSSLRRGVAQLLIATPFREDGLAFHFSHPSARISEMSADFADPKPTLARLVRYCYRTGLAVDFTTPNRLATLRRKKVVFMPSVTVMSDAEVSAFRMFAANGGRILADSEPGMLDEWMNRRAAPPLKGLWRSFDSAVLDDEMAKLQSEYGVSARERISGLPPQETVFRVREGGGVRVVGFKTESRCLGSDVEICLGSPGFVYAVDRGFLGRMDKVSLRSISVPFALYAVFEDEQRPPPFAMPQQARQGERVEWRTDRLRRGGVYRFSAMTPGGVELGHREEVFTADGKPRFFAFALDDEAGPWRFALRDIATGLETVVTTVLRK